MPIHILPPDVASRIAAGEVIERPSSVVKELLENALDAGAGEIAIEVQNGGVGLIRVTDNGTGLNSDDAELAFSRHATSKISGLEDLERISTLGFRGEALPSIAAVAGVEMLTADGTPGGGVYLRLENGEITARERRSRPAGTTFTVRHLFRSLPARLKFLK
jgi:DNA mismatch repair protein MutL